MCQYLSMSHQNPHTVIRRNCHTLWSLYQFSCTPTLASTLSTSCCIWIFNAGCFCVVRVLVCFLCILRNIFSLWDFSSFPYCHPALYLCGCGTCGMWSIFFVLGVTVIAIWTGRESGNCVIFIFIFVYAVLFLVLGLCCPWSWRSLRSPRFCLTGTAVLVAVVPIVGTSSSPDWPCPPINLAPSFSFDIAPRPMWQVFEGRCGWNLRRGCDCICIGIQSCGGRRWFLLPRFVAPPIMCWQG